MICIVSHNSYRDGGTVSFMSSKGEICIDFRIGTKTLGKLFWGYPGDECRVTPKEEREIVKSIKDYVSHLVDAYDSIDYLGKSEDEKEM